MVVDVLVALALKSSRLVSNGVGAQRIEPPIEIPIQVSGGRIFLPVTVNGKRAEFLLDSGASLCAIDLDWARRIGLSVGELGEMGGVGTKNSRVASVIGDALVPGTRLRFRLQTAIELEPLSKYNDRPILGILGLPFFQSNAVQIDLDAHCIRLFEADTYSPPRGAFIANHATSGGRIVLNLKLTLANGKLAPIRSELDLGALGSLLISTPFGVKTGMSGQGPHYSLQRTANGLGGGSPGIVCRVGSISVGNWTFARPTVRVSTATTGALSTSGMRDALIGYELFRRFRLTVDLPHDRLILEPSKEIHDPFPVDCCGILFRKDGNRYVVEEVVSGSPADKALVRVGDVIELIQGQAASALTYSILLSKLANQTSPLSLRLLRSGRRVDVKVARRPLV